MPDPLIAAIRDRVTDPPMPPLGPAQVAAAEGLLGVRLPPLLRDLYLTVGDGGFGPGFGLLRLADGDDSVVRHYTDLRGWVRGGAGPEWPAGRLPVCDWGCAKFSCVDAAGPPFPVWSFEYAGDDLPMVASFAFARDGLAGWLEDWLAGACGFEPVFEPAPERDRTTTNPFTGKSMVTKARRPRYRPE
jgi:SMI1 / KNR4 family (SUKH-1)